MIVYQTVIIKYLSHIILTTCHIIKCFAHNIYLSYLVKVEEAVTTALIEQTPPETYFDEEIRKHYPECLLQILEEDGTSEDGTSEDGTSEDGTSKDEVNAAIGLCAKCNRNIETRRCSRCQLLFCKPCLNNHHNEICRGTGISQETCQDKRGVSQSLNKYYWSNN